MGIVNSNPELYTASLQKLFPQGSYWEKQFANIDSDCSLFCKAKTDELFRFRCRMADLQRESVIQTAGETLEDWERVILDTKNTGTVLERRAMLLSRQAQLINKSIMATIATKHGLELIDIVFPFTPAFFGFSFFGTSIFSRPAYFSVFYIISVIRDDEMRAAAKKRIKNAMENSSFGLGHFGTGKFLNQSYFIKELANRIFRGINGLDKYEKEITGKLLASNIVYFLYKL